MKSTSFIPIVLLTVGALTGCAFSSDEPSPETLTIDEPVYDLRALDVLKAEQIQSLFAAPPTSTQFAAGSLFRSTDGFIDGESLLVHPREANGWSQSISLSLFHTHEEAVSAQEWRATQVSAVIRRGEGRGYPWWRSNNGRSTIGAGQSIFIASGNLLVEARWGGDSVEAADTSCWNAIQATLDRLRSSGLGAKAKLPPRSRLFADLRPGSLRRYGPRSECKRKYAFHLTNSGETAYVLHVGLVVDGTRKLPGTLQRNRHGKGPCDVYPGTPDTLEVPSRKYSDIIDIDFSGTLSLGEHVLEIWATDMSGAAVHINHRPLVVQIDEVARDRLSTRLAKALERPEAVRVLDLSEANLTEIPESISRLKNLEKLDLSHNHLCQLGPALFSLRSLRSLDLSHNHLRELDPALFSQESLRSLDLSSNDLTELPSDIKSLKELRELKVYRNQLTGLPETIGDLPNLRTLEAGANPLVELGDGVGRLHSLEVLTISGCQLKELPPSIGSLPALRRLKIYGNNLRRLPEEIGNISTLEDLHAEGNQLRELPHSIGRLTELKTLWIYNNQIEALPASIGGLRSLVDLRMGDNPISSLPEEIGQLAHLEKLILTDTRLQRFPESIAGLTQLQRIYVGSVTHNPRTSYHDLPENMEILRQLPSLKQINAEHPNRYWRKYDPARDGGSAPIGPAEVGEPEFSFRELAGLSPTLLYNVPAVANAPLINPATGQLLFWQLVSSPPQIPEDQEEPASYVVRISVARVEDVNQQYSAHLGPAVEATLCVGHLRGDSTDPECEVFSGGEALIEVTKDTEPVVAAVTMTPSEPGDYVLVADRLGGADMIMKMQWPSCGLPSELLAHGVLHGVPFTVLEEDTFFLNDYDIGDMNWVGVGYPVARYVKITIGRDDEVLSGSVAFGTGDQVLARVDLNLYRVRSQSPERSEYIGMFATMAEAPSDRRRGPSSALEVETRIWNLPVLRHPMGTGSYQFFVNRPERVLIKGLRTLRKLWNRSMLGQS